MGRSDLLRHGFETLRNQQGVDGVLPRSKGEGAIPGIREDEGDTNDPIADWRATVKDWANFQDLSLIGAQSDSPTSTLRILARAAAGIQKRGVELGCPIVHLQPCPINWIRIRLLSGTCSLNARMSRITRRTTARQPDCPMCTQSAETVEHFLRLCPAPQFVRARARHARAMPPQFSEFDPLGQCAFILCNEVDGIKQSEDIRAEHLTLVRKLWRLRKEALTRAQADGLSSSEPESDSESDRGQMRIDMFFTTGKSQARPARGVEAHGEIAMPS